MKRVLFIFSIIPYYREMLPVARFYKENGFSVHVVIGYSGVTADEASEACNAAGFTVHVPPTFLKYADHLAKKDGLGVYEDVKPVRVAFPLAALRLGYSLLASLRQAWRVRIYTERVVSETAPHVIFGGPFQSCNKIDNGIGRVARRRCIPYCCLPVFPYLGETHSIEVRFNLLESGAKSANIDVTEDPVNRILARVFPHWTRARGGRRIFMFEPLAMLAAQLTGLLERNPWQKPVESYDLVFVESEFTRRMLAESGFHTSKIIVSGKPLLDEVFRRMGDQNYRGRLYEELGLKDGERFVLFNVEPNYYKTLHEYWAYFRSWMECLKGARRSVVLSLHPLCDPEQYEFVPKEYGYVIAMRRKIAEIYPYCDMVVSFPCSTNTLSQVFKKPLIIYDVLGMTREGARPGDPYRFPGTFYAYGPDDLARYVKSVEGGSSDGEGSGVPPELRPACDVIYRTVAERFEVSERKQA